MSSNVIYLVLSVFDALAVLVLGLKLHRQLITEHHRVIAVCCIAIAFVSYLIRIVLDVPMLDGPAQMIMFTLFLRYWFKYKTHWAFLIYGTGIGAYIPIQLTLAAMILNAGIVDNSVISQAEGWGVSVIQISTIAAAIIFSYIFKYLGFGFSFIIQPPHNFSIKEDLLTATNKKLLIAICTVMVIYSIALITILHVLTLWIMPFSFLAFGLLYYYSNRRNDNLD